MGTIYILRNKTNGKCYVGQTMNSISVRINDHKRKSLPIGNALCKYGRSAFDIFEYLVPKSLLDYFEVTMIDKLQTVAPKGYNLSLGGHQRRIVSDATRAKISAANKGYIASKEARKKISGALKGKPKSAEHIRNAANAHRGSKWTEEQKQRVRGRAVTEEELQRLRAMAKNRPIRIGLRHSDESKLKMSIANMGRFKGALNSRARAVICIETGVVYGAISDAARATGCNEDKISRCCSGRAGKHHNLHWQYLEAG